MKLSKGDLVHEIRIGNYSPILKNKIGVVVRAPYEEIFQISKNPPVQECVIVVDLLIDNKIYEGIPIKNIKKMSRK